MSHEHSFRYVQCDVPEGVTLGRWRADRAAEGTGRRRLMRLPRSRGAKRPRAHAAGDPRE